MSFDKNDCPMEVIGQSHVRTEFQVRAWEGPEGIRAADRLTSSSGSHTPMLAVPEEWTKQAKCVDDWKAFDDGSARRTVAEQLCLDCPVMTQCLDQAMAEEGMQHPRFRAGVRGGLNTMDRFALAVGDKKCAAGHPFKQFGMTTSDGRSYCGECAREARTPKRTSTRKRDRSLWTCDNCGRTILNRNKNPHRRTVECREFVR